MRIPVPKCKEEKNQLRRKEKDGKENKTSIFIIIRDKLKIFSIQNISHKSTIIVRT